jgi:hypothetical protein
MISMTPFIAYNRPPHPQALHAHDNAVQCNGACGLSLDDFFYFPMLGAADLQINWVSIWGQLKMGENPKHSDTYGTFAG